MKTLIGAAGFLVVMVVVVLIAQGGGDEDATETPTKPEVEVPTGAPPDDLVVEDLEEGDGAEAKAGDALTVHYVGVVYDNGQEFDSSYDRGEPITFQLGTGGVIPGWDQGLEGMKEGGRRQLVIPPDLAYGKAGDPPDIPPDSTLVFVIDLISVN